MKVFVLSSLLIGGCAGHRAPHADKPLANDAGMLSDGSAPDAADAAADGGDAGFDSALLARIDLAIAAYDREMQANCRCLTAAGTYANEDDCLKFLQSGPDWQSCAAKALTSYGVDKALAGSDCLLKLTTESADCLEASNCDNDKITACSANLSQFSECLAMDGDAINALLVACPDFGLLTRVH